MEGKVFSFHIVESIKKPFLKKWLFGFVNVYFAHGEIYILF